MCTSFTSVEIDFQIMYHTIIYECVYIQTYTPTLVVKPKEPDKGIRTDRIPRGPITQIHSE